LQNLEIISGANDFNGYDPEYRAITHKTVLTPVSG